MWSFKYGDRGCLFFRPPPVTRPTLRPAEMDIPFKRQQYHSLMNEHAGVLELEAGERAELGSRIRSALRALTSFKDSTL